MEKLHRTAFLLRSIPALESMRACIHDQERLCILVRSRLPAELAPHCLYVQLNDGQLLIYADSSAWASRLRFFSRDLAARLKNAGLAVKKVGVRVLLANPERSPPVRTVNLLSPDNAALVAAVAEGIEDPDLATALRRLSRHVRR